MAQLSEKPSVLVSVALLAPLWAAESLLVLPEGWEKPLVALLEILLARWFLWVDLCSLRVGARVGCSRWIACWCLVGSRVGCLVGSRDSVASLDHVSVACGITCRLPRWITCWCRFGIIRWKSNGKELALFNSRTFHFRNAILLQCAGAFRYTTNRIHTTTNGFRIIIFTSPSLVRRIHSK
jgi:hypothetical protein